MCWAQLHQAPAMRGAIAFLLLTPIVAAAQEVMGNSSAAPPAFKPRLRPHPPHSRRLTPSIHQYQLEELLNISVTSTTKSSLKMRQAPGLSACLRGPTSFD